MVLTLLIMASTMLYIIGIVVGPYRLGPWGCQSLHGLGLGMWLTELELVNRVRVRARVN